MQQGLKTTRIGGARRTKHPSYSQAQGLVVSASTWSTIFTSGNVQIIGGIFYVSAILASNHTFQLSLSSQEENGVEPGRAAVHITHLWGLLTP